MRVQCSKCESKYNIKDEKIPDAGAKIKCPKCQNVISVMKPAPELPEWAPPTGYEKLIAEGKI